MKISETSLPGVLLLSPTIYRDTRGAFCETFNQRAMTAAGLPDVWVQDNFSLSKKNVLRGIHYQITEPAGEACPRDPGAVLDVAVDLRRSSPTFAKHVAFELRADTADMLWIPSRIRPCFPGTDRAGRLCLQSHGLLLPPRRTNPPLERSRDWNRLACGCRGCDCFRQRPRRPSA